MLTIESYIPTPHSADWLLKWLQNEVGLGDMTIINELLEFIAKNYDAEFRKYISDEYLIDVEKLIGNTQ